MCNCIPFVAVAQEQPGAIGSQATSLRKSDQETQ
jgi:hypothetical protein